MHPVAFYFHMQAVFGQMAEKSILYDWFHEIITEGEYNSCIVGSDRTFDILAFGKGKKGMELFNILFIRFSNLDISHVGESCGIGVG